MGGWATLIICSISRPQGWTCGRGLVRRPAVHVVLVADMCVTCECDLHPHCFDASGCPVVVVQVLAGWREQETHFWPGSDAGPGAYGWLRCSAGVAPCLRVPVKVAL